MDKCKALLKRRRKAYDKMPKTMDVLRGSLVIVRIGGQVSIINIVRIGGQVSIINII